MFHKEHQTPSLQFLDASTAGTTASRSHVLGEFFGSFYAASSLSTTVYFENNYLAN